MANDVKVLLMTRHGVKGNTPETKNWLYPESVQRMNQNTGGYLREFVNERQLTPGNTFAYHSDQVRTRNTGNAILAGAFHLDPFPQKQEDLANLEQRLLNEGLEMRMHQGLSYPADVKFNSKAYAENETLFMGEWIGGPDKGNIAGVPNTPFNQVRQSSRHALVDALGYLVNSDKIIGVLATHGGIVEGMVMDAVESGSDIPVTSLFQIGGYFPQEDYATIFIGPSAKTLIRPSGKSYNLNLDKLLGASA